MATFLQLCRDVHRYARIGQDPPGTAPEHVADQENQLAEIVGWVQDAYADIQLDQDAWRFREKSGTATVDAGVNTVDLATAFDDYEELRFFTADYCARYILARCASEGDDALTPVWFVEWERWRGGQYTRGSAVSATGRPMYFTVQPDGTLQLYPTPDALVVLQLAYQRDVHVLAEDDDEPIIPAKYHNAIVWRALMYYVDTRDNTAEPYKKWERRRNQWMRRLYREQLPEMSF